MSTLEAVAVAFLCAAGAGFSLWQAVGDSPTIDEPVYVAAGLTAITRHDLRLNPQHPPLGKALAALPVLAVHPRLPGGLVWAAAHERPYARVLLDGLRAARSLRLATLLSRLVPIAELVAATLVVYALAARVAGPPGGLVAASMWLLDPFVLGLGHVDGIDMPFTLAALAVALALVRWLERRTTARAAWVGLACGAALVVRDTGPLLLGVAALTVAIAARDIRPALLVGALAGLVVWVVYGVLDPGYTLHHANLLPQRYIDGFDALADAHTGPQGAFLLGHRWGSAHWWFWPVSAVVKLSPALLVGLVLAPLFIRRVPRPALRRVALAVLPSALALAAFTVASPAYLGFRYMLPVVGLIAVLLAPLARARRPLALLLVAGSAAVVIASLPHSLAWTNPPFRPAYRAVTDANLDWGQDVYALQRWSRGRRPWIACYSPKGVGCAQDVPGARPLGKHASPHRVHGWVAMSSTLLQLDGWDRWLRKDKPVGTIDGTVLLYHLPERA